jgi:hypothetical protein
MTVPAKLVVTDTEALEMDMSETKATVDLRARLQSIDAFVTRDFSAETKSALKEIDDAQKAAAVALARNPPICD